MRVLITWGSTRGGTEGIARQIATELEAHDVTVELAAAAHARPLREHDAVFVGGALYANRWHAHARRFVLRHTAALRRVPVWFFSSGPLDDSATRRDIPPPERLAMLMERVGARGHMTFGGRLSPDATGFPASAMAKKSAGDWRNAEHIRAWASARADELPTARPGRAVDHPAHSPLYLLAHAVAGWLVCAGVMWGFSAFAPLWLALTLHAVAAPLVFIAVSRHDFAARGSREPLPSALAFTAVVALLDLAVVAGLVEHSLAMFTSIAGTWLPFALIFLATWATGAVSAMLPIPKPEAPAQKPDEHAHGPGPGGAGEASAPPSPA